MAKAIFKCECGEVLKVDFKLGEKPEAPKCPKCGKTMVRHFGKVGIGDVVDDQMLSLGQEMLYS